MVKIDIKYKDGSRFQQTCSKKSEALQIAHAELSWSGTEFVAVNDHVFRSIDSIEFELKKEKELVS